MAREVRPWITPLANVVIALATVAGVILAYRVLLPPPAPEIQNAYYDPQTEKFVVSWRAVEHITRITAYYFYKRDRNAKSGHDLLVERKEGHRKHTDRCDAKEAICAYTVAAQTREVSGGRSLRVRCLPEEKVCIWNRDQTCSKPPERPHVPLAEDGPIDPPDPTSTSDSPGLFERIMRAFQTPKEEPIEVAAPEPPQVEATPEPPPATPEPDSVPCTPEVLAAASKAEEKARQAEEKASKQKGETAPPEEGPPASGRSETAE